MRNALRIALATTTFLALANCRYGTIVMPAQVAAGGTFSVEITFRSGATDDDPRTPLACVALPTGWSAGDPLYDGTLAGGPVSGTGVVDAGEAASMEVDEPTPGSDWHCWSFPTGNYAPGDAGSVFHEVTVPASASGRHRIRFGLGAVEHNGGDYSLAARHITVGPAADPLDAWEFAEPLRFGQHLFAVTYGHAGWITIGEDGTLLRSPDGLTWTEGAIAPAQQWRAIAYQNGRYVAVGPERVVWSEDGTLWYDVDDLAPYLVSDIAAGDGHFVAVGGQEIMRSDDGENWTVTTNVSSGTLEEDVYGDGEWMAIGTLTIGNIQTSTDGLLWMNGANSPILFDHLSYAGGRFIASGGDATDVWSQSTDLAGSWSDITASTPQVIYAGVTTDAGDLVFGRYGTILSTTDAVTFDERAVLSHEIFRDAHESGGRVVAVGDEGMIVVATVVGDPVFGDCDLPDARLDHDYEEAIPYTPGGGVHTAEVVSGAQPPGLALAGDTLVGIPTAPGDYEFEVRITDDKGASDSGTCTLAVVGDGPDDTGGDDTGPDDTGPDDTGCPEPECTGQIDSCGCASGGAGAAWLSLLPLIFLVRRRA